MLILISSLGLLCLGQTEFRLLPTDPALVRFVDGMQATALPKGKVDRLLGFEAVTADADSSQPVTAAFLIHAKDDPKPKPLGKQSLTDWTRGRLGGRNWLVVMTFEEKERADKFVSGWFANFPKNGALRALRCDTLTVVWGDSALVEKLLR